MGNDTSNRLKDILSGRTLVEKHGGLYASIVLTMICILVSVGITVMLHWILNDDGAAMNQLAIVAPVLIPILVALPASMFAFGLMEQLIHSEAANNELVSELNTALNEVKHLTGLLPICASCKDIEDRQGNWQSIEAYVSQHTEVNFSHGLCPGCAETLYPGNFPPKEDA